MSGSGRNQAWRKAKEDVASRKEALTRQLGAGIKRRHHDCLQTHLGLRAWSEMSCAGIVRKAASAGRHLCMGSLQALQHAMLANGCSLKQHRLFMRGILKLPRPRLQRSGVACFKRCLNYVRQVFCLLC